jgi:hypothetical protein
VLKISGRPLPRASSNASMQNLEQIGEAPRQHMTAHLTQSIAATR